MELFHSYRQFCLVVHTVHYTTELKNKVSLYYSPKSSIYGQKITNICMCLHNIPTTRDPENKDTRIQFSI